MFQMPSKVQQDLVVLGFGELYSLVKFYRFWPFEFGYVFKFTDTKPVKHKPYF